MFNVRLNVALTFNVKPESETFLAEVSPNQHLPADNTQALQDTYAEWDSRETIDAVKSALEEYHNVTLIEADYNCYNKLREINPQIVFNVAEGFFSVSREAQVPAILDMLNIPYTGSDPLTLAISLDKARTKEILTYHKIPNAKFLTINSLDELENIDIELPVIVKPVMEGSSKGIYSSSFVTDKRELEKEIKRILIEYKQPALVEEFLPGKEFTVAMLGNGDDLEVLPIVEINYGDFPKDFVPIYSYEAKWILDTKDNPLNVFECPAKISSELENEIKATAIKTFNVLKCRDWSRIDIRLDKNGVPNVIEVNPLPGILPDPKENSCYPKAARTKGYSYSEMLNRVLYSAAKRYNLL